MCTVQGQRSPPRICFFATELSTKKWGKTSHFPSPLVFKRFNRSVQDTDSESSGTYPVLFGQIQVLQCLIPSENR